MLRNHNVLGRRLTKEFMVGFNRDGLALRSSVAPTPYPIWGLFALKSPIGAALMGKKVGEIAEAQLPSGTFRLRIESITLD